MFVCIGLGCGAFFFFFSFFFFFPFLVVRRSCILYILYVVMHDAGKATQILYVCTRSAQLSVGCHFCATYQRYVSPSLRPAYARITPWRTPPITRYAVTTQLRSELAAAPSLSNSYIAISQPLRRSTAGSTAGGAAPPSAGAALVENLLAASWLPARPALQALGRLTKRISVRSRHTLHPLSGNHLGGPAVSGLAPRRATARVHGVGSPCNKLAN